MIVNKQEYYYKKLLKSANDNADKTIKIDDKEAILLGLESQEELSVNIISIEWENTNDIEIYEGIKPVLPNILIHWDDDTTTSIKLSNNKVVLSDISYYKTQGTYTLYASFNNFTTTNSINVNVIKDELISIEWSVKADISTQQNNKANLPYIQLNYISGKINNIAYNTSSVTLNNTEYYKTIGNYELYATYKGFTTDILNVYVYNDEYEKLKNQELCFTPIIRWTDQTSKIHIELYNCDKEFSLDNKVTWTKCTGQHIYLDSNQSIYIRALNDFNYFDYASLPFKNVETGWGNSLSASGNIFSLRYKTIFNNFDLIKESIKNYLVEHGGDQYKNLQNFDDIDITTIRLFLDFSGLFKDKTWLSDIGNLYLNCESYENFEEMFMNCINLINTPKLPSLKLLYNSCYKSMFKGCTKLTEVSELPATILPDNCYSNMFENCTSLINIPNIKADILSNGSCYAMFKGCTSIVNIENLTSSTLSISSYEYMFENCTSLEAINKISAINLSQCCCEDMFKNCTKLIKAPKILPATTLARGCYLNMFLGCVSLTYPPQLPATTLAPSCYQGMFKNCNSLVNAPELPATILADNCYGYSIDIVDNDDRNNGMFQNCNSLINAPKLPATILANNCYGAMFSGCINLINAPELPATILADNCYEAMFSGCINLVNVSELPATTLTNNCYQGMFVNCSNLLHAPELPAITLTSRCYQGMFENCRSLVNAPELPATILNYACYDDMFSGCTSLTDAPELPATTMTNYCYAGMFENCRSLVNAPELPAIKLSSNCYKNMFNGCTSLIKAPELPAIELANGCYGGMFYLCKNIDYIKLSIVNINNNDINNIFIGGYTVYDYNWLSGVSSTGIFVKNIEAQYNNKKIIPENWTVIYYDTNENKYYIDQNKEQECDDHGNIIQ